GAGALVSSRCPQWRRRQLQLNFKGGSAGSEVRLRIQSRDGAQREVVLHRSVKEADAVTDPRAATVAELEPGIMYFDIGRATDEDLDPALPKLAQARAVIFDLRGYPKTSDYLLHLSDQRLQSPIWQIPIVTMPDRQGIPEYDSAQAEWAPIEPRVKGRVIFMTDGQAISSA